MAETITLKKSGVVLTQDGLRDFYAVQGAVSFHDRGILRANCWTASETFTSRDECLAWLDARVLALRSALMPADAVERVAKWLVAHARCDGFGNDYDAARAVLAALGIEEVRNG